MQISQQSSPGFTLSLPSFSIRQVLILIALIAYTALLAVQTLQIQHSCSPLMGQETCPQGQYLSSLTSGLPQKVYPIPTGKVDQPPVGKVDQPPVSTVDQPTVVKELAVAAAGGAAIVGLAVGGVPIVVAAGVGFGLWLLIHQVF